MQNNGKTLKRKPKVLLVTGYWKEDDAQSIIRSALKLLEILGGLSSSLTWIVTNQSTNNYSPIDGLSSIVVKSGFSAGWDFRSFYYKILHQMKITVSIIRLVISSKVDIIIFAFNSDMFIVPLIFSRILGKKVILRSDGRPSYVLKMYYREKNKIKIFLVYTVESLVYSLVNRLLPECQYMIHLYDLDKYSNKLSVGNLYIDTIIFKPTKPFSERKYQIGYIGNFFKEKGIIEFVKSLYLLVPKSEFSVLLVGNGELKDEVQKLAFSSGIRVDILEQAEQKEVSNYLNDTKLLVVPSLKEGLPNIILEAMACGTPVLATPVGGIPEVVRDGETGFIMENNSPECIAANITRALFESNMPQITDRALELIKREYSYSAAVKRFEQIL